MTALRPSALLSSPVGTVEAGTPVAGAVDAYLRRAVAARASDLHVEPSSDGAGRTRLRVDGLLRAGDPIRRELYAPLVSRLKLLAGLDISNRRLPQDGRYSVIVDGRRIDARVSSIPTIDGEKLVIRLLDHHVALPRLDDLGLDAAALNAYRRVAHAPWGFVVVSGPTGSGKTTTLYASIAELDRAVRNVCTVEDPIEARLSDVAQVQVNVRAGLTFPVTLRSFVRQDPDVILIGEMRDQETAAVGVSAALAGQTVFATVHSNDAPRTIDRLVELGVERHSLAAALTAVVAQRLVRKLCTRCRRREPVPAPLRASFPDASGGWFVPSGCAECEGTGYAGRTGVFEVLEADDAIREAIAAGVSSATLAHVAA
ncbi:MAG TPA: GspE/PulE family protein, partial [Candidatus Lustribacter sp.]|nr:GspE/PulE family protein [Candidatus Lustribacter sp.]